MALTKTHGAVSTPPLLKLAGVCVYVYFFAIFIIWTTWVGYVPGARELLPPSAAEVWDVFAPRPFYGVPVRGDKTTSLLIDLALLLAFCIPHSVFALPSTKATMGLGRLERVWFVLQSAALLHAQMLLWRPVDEPVVWDARGTALGAALQAQFFVGMLWLLTSTFALDHFELFGLSQALGFDLNKAVGLAPTTRDGLAARAHYALVAHPIMTGFIITFCGAPLMTPSRLLFTVVNCAYCVCAAKLLEEPRLEREIGPAYTEYLRTVASFCPFAPAARAPKAATA